MDVLRQELIETQKARSELMKWKLLLISGLGAAGLGFAGDRGEPVINAEALLCCIPLVCVYVDAQYVNLALRIMGIASFLGIVGPKIGLPRGLTAYEEFMASCREAIKHANPRTGFHSFQSWVVRSSSGLFSGLVAFYGLALLAQPGVDSRLTRAGLLLAGVGGVVFDIWLFRHADARQKVIRSAAERFAAPVKDHATADVQSCDVPCTPDSVFIGRNAPAM